MSDDEMTKLCAEAMGMNIRRVYNTNYIYDGAVVIGQRHEYRPLYDDAQAMALVKRFELASAWQPLIGRWWVHPISGKPEAYEPDLNRAIVTCVAEMQARSPLLKTDAT